MLGGFTFKGIHSSVYGVRETPTSTALSPLKRRNLIEIPGRSNSVIQEDGGYEPNSISLLCTYVPDDPYSVSRNTHKQARKIAGWLDGVGELTLDYEPGLHYNAYLSSSPPTTIMLEYAAFTLDFTITHPFAYETAIQKVKRCGYYISHVSGQEWLNLDNKIDVVTAGTMKTPVKIIIRNVSSKPITSLKVTHKYIEI